MNKFKKTELKIIFWLLLLCCLSLESAAETVIDQLRIVEKAVVTAVARIESGLLTEQSPGENFQEKCGRQFEFAMLNAAAGHLLEEDYYNLALYMMAAHFKQHLDAIKVLEYELNMARHRPVKKWLSSRIERLREIQKANNQTPAKKFSIVEEFKSLRQSLTR